jgi:flagellar motor switch protein FliG
MTTRNAEHRVSVLLQLLGPNVSSSVLEGLPENRQRRLKDRLKALKESPPTGREVMDVLQEFDRLLRYAASTDVSENEVGIYDEPPIISPLSATDELNLSSDPFEAIEQIDQERLIAALRDEAPRTVAVVLTCLNEKKAADILGQLSSELRDGVVLQLKEQFTPSLRLLTTLLAATVEKCRTFEAQELAAEKVSSESRVAKLLRTMESERRAEVFSMLEGADPEACERIRDALFNFDDIAIIEDRSLQKLLGEIDTATLSIALKNADKSLTTSVLNNLGKRAREALTEEIALLGDVGKTELADAERTVIKAMIELDKVGELVMRT